MHNSFFSLIGRLALLLLALAVASLAAAVVASALGVLPVGQLEIGDAFVTVGISDLPLGSRLAWGAGAFVVGIATLAVLLSMLRRSGDRSVLLSSGRRRGMLGGGTLEVSARSLHALATYSCERIDGVLEAFAKIKLKRRGWHADVELVLAPKAHVRDVAQAVRAALDDAMRNHTSISVARLRIWAQLDPLSKRRRVY